MTPKERYRRRNVIGITIMLAILAVGLFFIKEIRELMNRDWGTSGVVMSALAAIMVGGCVWVIGAGALIIRRHRQAILRATQLANEGRSDEAIEVLRSALVNRTMDALLYLQMSYIESARGRHEAAIEAIDDAERVAGPTDWIEAGRSTALWNAEHSDEAVEVCRQAVVRWPESLNSRLSLAGVLIAQKQFDEAQEALSQVRQLIVDSPFEKSAHQQEWTRVVDALAVELNSQIASSKTS